MCLALSVFLIACSSGGNGSSGGSFETATDNGIEVVAGFWSNINGTQLFLNADGTWEHFAGPNPPTDPLLTQGDWTLSGDNVTFSGTVVEDASPDFPTGSVLACIGSVEPRVGGSSTLMHVACSLFHLDTNAEDDIFQHNP